MQGRVVPLRRGDALVVGLLLQRELTCRLAGGLSGVHANAGVPRRELPRRQLRLQQRAGLGTGDVHPLPGAAEQWHLVLGHSGHFVGGARRCLWRRGICGGRVHVAPAALARRCLVYGRALRRRRLAARARRPFTGDALGSAPDATSPRCGACAAGGAGAWLAGAGASLDQLRRLVSERSGRLRLRLAI